jgi:tRNA(fMet)-specific endonuclease VapC
VSLRFLLDTTIVSAPVARQPNARVIKKLEQHSLQCAIAAPVWHELVYGCSRLPAGQRRAGLENYLREVVRASFPILPYDADAAAWHAKERARLEESGKTPPFVDGQIAAIARIQGLAVVTANEKDFRAFEGLDVVDWTG